MLNLALLCMILACFPLYPTAVRAEEPIFSFSAGVAGYERDGSAYREMELLYRGNPVQFSSVQIAEARCQYRIRRPRTVLGVVTGDNRLGKPFFTHVVALSPREREGRLAFRVTASGAAGCNLLLYLHSEGKSYVVQRQFNLYGRSWNRAGWEQDPASVQGVSHPLRFPYLAIEALRNPLTGQTVTGRYQNTERPVSRVEVYSEERKPESVVTTGPGGEICYRLPLAKPLEAVPGYKAKNKVFTTLVRNGQTETTVITQLDFYDNYHIYDSIPQGTAVMGVFALLTAGSILFLRRREARHVY